MNENKKHSINIELITQVLSGKASAANKDQLQKWRGLSDKNEKEFQAISKLWSLTAVGDGRGLIDIDEEWNVQQKRINPKGRIISLPNTIAIAASIVLLFTLSILGYQFTQQQTIKTSTAEIIKQELPDGSVVSLNAQSKIKYTKQFGEKNRSLKLEGEGFFDVTKDKELPFKIETNIAIIEVVGTQFNVNAYPKKQEVKVTVTEGTVWLYAIQNSQDTITIQAGETGIIRSGKDAPEKIKEIDLNDLGWETKSFDFNDASLLEVCSKLANAYHVEFEINPKVENCIITVFFDQQELGPILQVLKNTLDLQVGKKGEKIYITGDGCD